MWKELLTRGEDDMIEVLIVPNLKDIKVSKLINFKELVDEYYG